MQPFSLIFSSGAGLLIVISGIFKIMALKKYILTFDKFQSLSIMSRKFIASITPFLEVILGILLVLLSENIVVSLSSLFLFCIFILINANAMLKKDSSDCMCFGKVIKTRLGKGGIVQSLLLTCSVIPSVIFKEQVASINFIAEYSIFNLYILIVTILIWTFTLILVRIIIDKLSPL